MRSGTCGSVSGQYVRDRREEALWVVVVMDVLWIVCLRKLRSSELVTPDTNNALDLCVISAYVPAMLGW